MDGVARTTISQAVTNSLISVVNFKFLRLKLTAVRYVGLCPRSSIAPFTNSFLTHQCTTLQFSTSIFTIAVAKLPLPTTPTETSFFVFLEFEDSEFVFFFAIIEM